MGETTHLPGDPGGTQPPGPGSSAYTLPERFQNQTAEQLAQRYEELERTHQDHLRQYAPYERLDGELRPYGGLNGLISAYNTLQQQQVTSPATTSRPTTNPAPTAPAQPTGAAADIYWQDWDVLPGREQALRVVQAAVSALEQRFGTLYQQALEQIGQQIQTQQTTLRNEWDIYRQVSDATRSNPGIDAQALMETMVSLSTGDTPDLVQVALSRLTADTDAEAKAQTLFQAYKADFEQQQKEHQEAALHPPGMPPPDLNPEQGFPTVEQENAAIGKRLLEQGVVSTAHF